ncbi:MAG: nitroreductase [Lentisphaerae bacterium]|nr:nitroreductase [Lentisphaerota bacterium]
MTATPTTDLPQLPADADVARTVDDALTSRRSVRAFLPAPVPRALIEHILEVASRAPSGTNMQPWCVHVVAGEAKDKLSRAILDAHEAGGEEHTRPWKYYPDELFEPYLSRRRAVGWGLYGLLGIGKGDHAQMKAQRAQNYLFFGAPVGMFFTLDARLEIGSWLDYGMFIQSIMTSARGHGLHTCPQAAFADYHKIIRAHLGIPEDHTVICGLSIGYEDTAAAANRLRTDRVPVSEFARFIGYE